jgi:hypothetical protein
MKFLKETLSSILLIALLWTAVINSGTLGTLDTDLRLQMAHAWWTGTEEVQVSPDDTPIVRGDIRFGVMGVDGKRYIAYEEGQSILMLPGDWVGTQLHHLLPIVDQKTMRDWTVNLLIFMPLNAAAVAACYWLLKLFGFKQRTAGLAAIAWFLGTTILHYAQVHQHNNQVLLLVTLGYGAALSYVLRDRPLLAFLSGLALGGTVLIRITSIIHGLTVALFLAGGLAYRRRDFIKVVHGLGLWVAGFIPFVLLGRIMDYLRYGSLFATGKSIEQQQLTTDPAWNGLPDLPDGYPLINEPHVGILGPLISLSKSIFIYDPLLLPCLILGVVFWKKLTPYIQWYLVTVTVNLGLHLVAYSRFVFWHGDSAWAARYHVTSVHLLLIPLVAVLIQRLSQAKAWKAWLLKTVVAIAIMVQLASVAMPMNLEIYQANVGMPGSRLEFRLAQRINNLVCLVDGSFSKACTTQHPDKEQYLEHLNHLVFLPFTYSQQTEGNGVNFPLSIVLFVLWGLLLVLALWVTVGFVFA